MAYSVAVTVTPQIEQRDVVTTLLRFFLVLPHVILVAGPGAFASGLLGSVAAFLAFVNWCAIVVTGQSVAGIDEFVLFFLRWHLRASAYAMLLVDPYPPFGDGDYPATLTVERPSPGPRDRVSVGLRLILVIPQVIVLAVIAFIWAITAIIAWFAIVFTGRYPASLYPFGVGALRWTTRVNAYVLLVCDDYPPFSLE
jgi:hypothetical protein